MSIVLIGYRGSGKSSVGRALAARLGRAFVDTDERVVAGAGGQSIKAIFAAEGEAGFRAREARAVADAVADASAVVALGGGAVLDPASRATIRSNGKPVVYLRCDAAELHRRIHGDPATAASRPSLTHLGGGLAEIEALLAVREPIYRGLCTAEVDVTGKGVVEVVGIIASHVAKT